MRKILSYGLLILSLTGCVEQFDINSGIQGQNTELVVEATLSDESKRHEVRLSRTRDFAVVNERDSIYDPSFGPDIQNINRNTFEFESNARVSIEDDMGNVFTFSEADDRYISDTEFAAQQGVSYTLKVETANGSSYVSNPEKYEYESEIERVYVERDRNDSGSEGVFIYVDGGSTNPNARYFRYDYQETYKIIAPEWRAQDYVLTNYEPCALPVVTYDLDIILRGPDEQRDCYRTDPSSEIRQTTTVGLEDNRVSRFPVRFIDRSNYIISHRYSILVSQHTQSADAYNFYRTLANFSASESIFSEVQPGLLKGNMRAVSSEGEIVLGFFEVASVSQRRIFFNYEDLFPGEPLPEYPISCFSTERDESHRSYCDPQGGGGGPLSLIESVNLGLVAYYTAEPLYYPDGVLAPEMSHTTVPRACGDCTLFGNDEAPDFWEE